MYTAELVVADRAILGEGPVWHAAQSAVYWLDIKGRRALRYRPDDGDLRIWDLPLRVGSLAPRANGGFVVGTERGFATIDDDFKAVAPICDPEADRPGNRFNDGKVDRVGRFWAGTMDDAEMTASGALYRLDPELGCTRIDDGYHVTNGPAFGVDGRAVYHSDSGRQIVYRFDLDPLGNVTGKRVFARFGVGQGYPDGMTVDAEDCLWIAFWDGWCLRRLSPDGTVLAEVPMPVARPTSLAFGGARLDELFVTSATIGLDAEALVAQPAAGGLLRLVPGVRGVESVPYQG